MPQPGGRAARAAPRRDRPSLWRWLLGIPLFYKILIANGALVLAGTAGGGLLTTRYAERHPGASLLDLVGGLAIAGILVTILINALILRLALRPLAALERTAERVQSGDARARVAPSPLADRQLDRLTRTFNAMLDAAESNRVRLREVASRALGAAEEERKRIARELHDETAQSLAAILLRMRVLRASADPLETDRLLEELRIQLGEALEGIRRFARGLRPPALDELGLVPAIEAHVRSIRAVSEVSLALEADVLHGDLSAEAELAVYRIVQEALSNVLRHSRARRASVRLTREADRLVIVVEDDGRGFDPVEIHATRAGLGLFGMSERAAYLGGRLDVRSTPGRGTRVRAEIPTGSGTPAPGTDGG
jgi:two-component system, NarL family, sensor histidine kinase UhpB